MNEGNLKRTLVVNDVVTRKTQAVSFGDLVGVLPQPAKAHTVEKMTQAVRKILAKKYRVN